MNRSRSVILSEEQNKLVTHFSNWNKKIFSSTKKSPRYVLPPLYYIGTQAKFDDVANIESIAFCI